jgi:hypothetical protein
MFLIDLFTAHKTDQTCDFASYKASRRLPALRLLRQGDLSLLPKTSNSPSSCKAAYVGRYLTSEISKDWEVALKALPEVIPVPATAYRLEVKTVFASYLNAGASVNLYSPAKLLCPAVPVLHVSLSGEKPALILDLGKATGCDRALSQATSISVEAIHLDDLRSALAQPAAKPMAKDINRLPKHTSGESSNSPGQAKEGFFHGEASLP